MSEVNRRLAAIMFTDIVGYTALMAESEERGRRARERHRAIVRPLIERHGGEPIEARGDESLSLFRSALDAVQCALEIQDRVASEPDLSLHVGIHLGDVVFEGGEVSGDGVNIASRICALSEGGGVCASGEVYQAVRNQASISSRPLGPRELKNVGRPVDVYLLGSAAARGPIRETLPRRRRWRVAAVVAASAAIGLAAALFLSWPAPLGLVLDLAGIGAPPENPALPDRPSIVVLPFTNMSRDPDQEYFADGMTEELTASLSRNPRLFVISRNSAFTYRGRAVNVGEVGRELGVRYVLEGSVRKEDERVRITAQLIDATTNFHLWSEFYERDFADIFALQSEIAERILTALQVEIGEAELRRIRRTPTENLSAYDLMLRGLSLFFRFTRKDNARARELFERVLELDPDYAQAYAVLGWSYYIEHAMAWSFDRQILERGEMLALRAIELDASNSWSHLTLARAHMLEGRLEEAVAAAHRGVELDPNSEWSHTLLATAQLEAGQNLAALQSIRRALRLNPRAPAVVWVMVAWVNAAVGRSEEAVELWERLRAQNPDLLLARIPLAIHYEDTGRHDEARAVVQEIRRVNPEMTAALAFDALPGDGRPLFPDSDPAHEIASLRQAGLP